jgi:diaminopimelate decarboxylase
MATAANASTNAPAGAAADAASPGRAAAGGSLSHVFPRDSALDARGRIAVGGCDLVEVAREHGTPAYVVAEEDLHARADEFREAARAARMPVAVAFGSKAFPCTAVLRIFAEAGLWCDVASGGELHLALAAGFAPERLVLHGNAKSEAELSAALAAGVGLIVLDNLDEIERLGALIAGGGLGGRASQPVLVRATPDVRPDTHEKIATGQADSKFGFSMEAVPHAIARVREIAGLELRGIHAHVGSQLLDLEPLRRCAAQLATLGRFPVVNLGGGLGVAYTAEQAPPTAAEYVAAIDDAVREHLGEPELVLIEPGRSLVARACVTIYTVESVKRNVSTYVAVDGGMSDNLRPMLYGARYEAHVADRPHGRTRCVLAGKHCESGDILVREALLDEPRAGDVVVTPVTGAYTHALANNYNGVPRPPVVFCREGGARVVVRRETPEDLLARDVR